MGQSIENLYDEEERLLHELDLIEERIDDLAYGDWTYIHSRVSEVNRLKNEWDRIYKELEVVQRCIADKESVE